MNQSINYRKLALYTEFWARIDGVSAMYQKKLVDADYALKRIDEITRETELKLAELAQSKENAVAF